MSGFIGFLLWGLLTYPAWSPRWRRLRRGEMPIPVSRNRIDLSRLDEIEADMDTWGVGPKWEQDRPMMELWEDDDS